MRSIAVGFCLYSLFFVLNDTILAELRNEMVADPIPLVAAVFAAIGYEDADLAHGQGPHEPGVVHGHFTRSTDQEQRSGRLALS